MPPTRLVKLLVDAKSVTQAGKKVGTLATNFKKVGSALSKVQSGIFNLKNLIIGFAAFRVGGIIKDMIELSGEIAGVSQGFENLVKSQGESADLMLTRVSDALDGTVDKLTLMRAINNALLLGLPAQTSKMAELADMAQRLGRAVGRGPVDAFNDLTIGIGRQSRMILDNLGIIVDAEKANKDYASSLGKTVAALTDAERKTAFYNATIEGARKKVAALGEEHLTAKDKLAQVAAQWADMKVKIAETLQESGVFNVILETTKGLIGDIGTFIVTNKDDLVGTIQSMAAGFKIMIGAVPGMLNLFSFIVRNQRIFLTIFGALKGGQTGAAFGPIGAGIGALVGAGLGFGIGTSLQNNIGDTNIRQEINVTVPIEGRGDAPARAGRATEDAVARAMRDGDYFAERS